MKTIVFALTLIIASFFSGIAQTLNAEVNKVMGFYVFTDNLPAQEYTVLGIIDSKNHNDSEIKSSGAQYEPVRNYLIQKARNTYYDADAIILNLVNGGTDQATVIKLTNNKSPVLSKITRKNGYYIFTDCEPLSNYKYIGTVQSKNTAGSAQYTALRDKLIKRGKKSFPEANGIILRFVNGGTDSGEMILFE